jgi:hypothetical protein
LDFYRNQLAEETGLQATPHDGIMVARSAASA